MRVSPVRSRPCPLLKVPLAPVFPHLFGEISRYRFKGPRLRSPEFNWAPQLSGVRLCVDRKAVGLSSHRWKMDAVRSVTEDLHRLAGAICDRRVTNA